MGLLSAILVIGFVVSWYLQRRRLATVRDLSAKLTEQHERWARDQDVWQQRINELRQRYQMCGFHYHTVMEVCLDCKQERGE